MGKIIQKIKSGKVLVADGGWGTMLQKQGMKSGECPEYWNIIKPEIIKGIARNYAEAGAMMVETNSFGGSSFKLEKYGLSEKVHEINEAAAMLSREAVGKNRFVLGSIGPTGKFLLMGEVTPEDLYESFKQQALALEAGGADAIMIETMSDLDEAKLAVWAARENTKCEVFCTMTFDRTSENDYHTMMGISPEDMLNELTGAGAEMIGANCGRGIKDMIGIVKAIRRKNKEIPVMIQANAGLPVYREGNTIYPETPENTASYVRDLIDAGVNVIGGCCGTTPEHIRRIAEEVKGYRIKPQNT